MTALAALAVTSLPCAVAPDFTFLLGARVLQGFAAAATSYCLDHPKLVAGSFLIATILVLTQIGNDIQWKLTIQRIVGTLGGVLLLAGLMRVVGTVNDTEVLGVPLPVRVSVIGIAFAVLAVISKFSPRQWIYSVFIAPAAVVTLVGGWSSVGRVMEAPVERRTVTMVGVVVR